MKKTGKEIINIFLRYLIVIVLAAQNFYIFYLIFTPITIYASYFILNLFFEASLETNIITIGCAPIEIISSCVAGSAYFLLFALNMALPNIKLKKRVSMIAFAFASFFVLNILRIIILSSMYYYGSTLFDITHKILWYLISIVFVIAIWFLEVKLFKINQIPFYSDLNFFYKKSSLRKKTKENKEIIIQNQEKTLRNQKSNNQL